MTTTLRPLEPEQRGPDGGRSRRYAVCVNSRQVGEVLVGTRPGPGRLVGEVSQLRIDEPDRRRGRATVAALAAEEVLRQWGCGTVRTCVPAGSVPGLRLTTALGYTERNRNMVKELAGPPPALPAGYAVRPLTEPEFTPWLAEQTAGYVRELAGTGMTEEQARAHAAAGHARFLPDGPGTAGAALRVLSRDGVDVGVLWVGPYPEPSPGGAWIYDVEVAEEHRGHGHGRALMHLAEAESAALGASHLGLNVFAGNTPALRLYESLGYETTTHYFAKPLL
jgi:ribosomal protein S18 acetylase RimI-like enzyme